MLLTVSTNIPTNQWNLTDLFVVKFTCSDPAAIVYYTTDGSTPTLLSQIAVNNKALVFGQGIIQIRYFANNGIISSQIYSQQIWMDNVTPTSVITVSHAPEGTNGWYYTNVSISISATDASSGVAKIRYRWDDNDFSDYNFPLSIPSPEGVHELQYFAIDVAGNIEATNLQYFKLDDTPPITVDDAPIGIQEKALTINLLQSDNASGVAETFFTTDGTIPTTQSSSGSSISLSKTGSYDVKYFSVDLAGNKEKVENTHVNVDIDVTPPSASDIYVSENIPIDGKFGWYKTPPQITLSADDSIGIQSIIYKFTNTNGNNSAKFTGSNSLLPKINWGNLIAPYLFDITVDNNSLVEVQITADVVTITDVINVINNTLQQTIATETGKDGTAGIGYITLTSPTAGSKLASSQIRLTAPSNPLSDATKVLFGLDPAAYPYIFLETDVDTQYVSPMYLPYDGEWTLTFYAIDTKGNSSPTASKLYRLDQQKPITNLVTKFSTDNWFIVDPQISFNVFDFASGASKTYYRWDNGPLYEYNGGILPIHQNDNILTYFSMDKAGNVEDFNEFEFKIDTIAPVTNDNSLELEGVFELNTNPGWTIVENEIAIVTDATHLSLVNPNVKDILYDDNNNLRIRNQNAPLVDYTVIPYIFGIQFASGIDRNVIEISPAVNLTDTIFVDYEYDDSHLPEELNTDDPINKVGYGLTEPIYVPLSHDSNILYKLEASDDSSGVKATYLNVYTIADGTFIEEAEIFSGLTTEYIFSEDGLYQTEFWSIDNAGNEESHKHSLPIKIEKNWPEISFIVDPPNGNSGWYKSPFNLVVYASTTDLIDVRGGIPNLLQDMYDSCFVDTFLIVAGENDHLKFSDPSPLLNNGNITITAGIYAGADLATFLQNALNYESTVGNYYVSYDLTSHRFTIGNTFTNFSLDWTQSNSASVLGFDNAAIDTGSNQYLADYFKVRMSNKYADDMPTNVGLFIQYVFTVVYTNPFQILPYAKLADRGPNGVYNTINIGGIQFPTDADLDKIRVDYKHYVSLQEVDYGLNSSSSSTPPVIDPVSSIAISLSRFDDFAFDNQGIPRAARYKIAFSSPYFYLANGDGYHTVSIRVLDKNSLADTDVLQKRSSIRAFSFRYDATAPGMPIDDYSYDADYNGVPFIVTVTSHDDMSGVYATFYTTDGSIPTINSQKAEFISESQSHIVLTQSGTYYLTYIVEDVAGNLTSPNTSGLPIFVDGDAPITLISVIPDPPDGNVIANTDQEKGWFVTSPVVTLTSSDVLSGVKETFYKFGGDYINNGQLPQSTFIEYTGPFEVGLEGNIDVEFYAVDNAGNKEITKKTVLHIDKTAPETIYDLQLSGSNVIVTFDANDEVSGRDKTFFSLTTPMPVTSSFEQDDSFEISESILPLTFYYYSTDKAGNIEDVKTSVLQQIVGPRIRQLNPIPNAYDVSTKSNVVVAVSDDFGLDVSAVDFTIQSFEFKVISTPILGVYYKGPRPNARLTIQNSHLITYLSGQLDLSLNLQSNNYSTIEKLNDYLNNYIPSNSTVPVYVSTILDGQYRENLSDQITPILNQKISNSAKTLNIYIEEKNPYVTYIENDLGYLFFITPDFEFAHGKYVNITINATDFINKVMAEYDYSFVPSIVATPSIQDRNFIQKQALTFIDDMQKNTASNYTRSRSTSFYGHQKAIAKELARVVQELQALADDESVDTVRQEYLYQKVGYLLKAEPTTESLQSTELYRSLLTSLLSIFLKGSKKSSIEQGITLYAPFSIVMHELFQESSDISDQFTVSVDYLIGQSRLIGIDYTAFIANISHFFKIVKPAHVWIKQRNIFSEAMGQIKISDRFQNFTIDGRQGFLFEMPELPEDALQTMTFSTKKHPYEENAGDAIGINYKPFILNQSILNGTDVLGVNAFEELISLDYTYDLSALYNINLNIDGSGAHQIDLRGAIPAATTITEIIANINVIFPGCATEEGFINYFLIDSTNDKLDFQIGATVYTATIVHGLYNAADMIAEIMIEMNAQFAGFVVNFEDPFENYYNHQFVIVNSTSFSLLWASGPNASTTIGTTIGFDIVDDPTSSSHVADNYVRHDPMLGAILLTGSTSIEFTAPSGNDATDTVFGLDASYPHTFYEIFSNINKSS